MKARIIAAASAAAVAVTTTLAAAASPNQKYTDNDKAYTINNLLTDYQAVTGGSIKVAEGVLKGQIDVVGGVAVKGAANIGTLGKAQLVPSYVGTNNVDNMSPQSKFETGGNHDLLTQADNADYFDFAKALELIGNQSVNAATESQKVFTEADIHPKTETWKFSYLELNVDEYSSFSIPYSVFDQVEMIDFVTNDGKTDDAETIKELLTKGITVSVTGVGDNDIRLGAGYPINEPHHAYLSLNAGGDGNTGKLDHAAAQSVFSDIEYNGTGMNLVLNFPDAKGTISTHTGDSVTGHIVAPKASVNVGGNLQGGIIAGGDITLSNQIHFHPYYPVTDDGKATRYDKDSQQKGKITVTVKDTDGNVIPNAGITITDSKGNVIKKTTDSTGSFTAEDIATGDATVEITAVPDGYTVSGDKTKNVTVTADSSVPADFIITKTPVQPAQDKGTLKVTVKDDNGNVVPGANVKVSGSDGDNPSIYPTDENGTITIPELTAGDYITEIISVPTGYELPSDKVHNVTVSANDIAKSDYTLTGNGTQEGTGSLKVTAVFDENGNEIPFSDGELIITNELGNVVYDEQLTSNGIVIVPSLPLGDYTVELIIDDEVYTLDEETPGDIVNVEEGKTAEYKFIVTDNNSGGVDTGGGVTTPTTTTKATTPASTTTTSKATTPASTTTTSKATTPASTTTTSKATTPASTTTTSKATTPASTTTTSKATTPASTTTTSKATTPASTTTTSKATTPASTTTTSKATTPASTTTTSKATTPASTTTISKATTPASTTTTSNAAATTSDNGNSDSTTPTTTSESGNSTTTSRYPTGGGNPTPTTISYPVVTSLVSDSAPISSGTSGADNVQGGNGSGSDGDEYDGDDVDGVNDSDDDAEGAEESSHDGEDKAKTGAVNDNSENKNPSDSDDNAQTGYAGYAGLTVAALLTSAAAIYIGKKKYQDKD